MSPDNKSENTEPETTNEEEEKTETPVETGTYEDRVANGLTAPSEDED